MQKEAISLCSLPEHSFCTLIFVSPIRCFIISPTTKACAVMRCCGSLWFAQMCLSENSLLVPPVRLERMMGPVGREDHFAEFGKTKH